MPSAIRLGAEFLRAAWFPFVAYTTPAGLKVADLVGSETTSPSLLSSCTVQGFDVVSSGSLSWVVWAESCDGPRIRAQRVDGFSGAPVGPTVTVAGEENDPGTPTTGFAVTSDGAGRGFYLVWGVDDPAEPGTRRVVAALFEGVGGSRLSDVQDVSGPLTDASAPLGSLAATSLFGGELIVSWRGDGGELRIASFSEDLVPLEEMSVAQGANGLGRAPLLDADSSAEAVALAWRTEPQSGASLTCPLRAFDTDLRPLGPPADLDPDCGAPQALAFSELTHVPLVAWEIPDDPVSSVCTRTEIAATAPAGLPPSPQGGGIQDPEFPDFVFYTIIGGDEPNPRTGRAEPLCLPETVCVSGALAGRTEVLLRVVGPKPNGRLWPTIVRFTTSQVEVWIEQLSTGEVEYYLLEGSSPGSEELDGLFDREGFPPG